MLTRQKLKLQTKATRQEYRKYGERKDLEFKQIKVKEKAVKCKQERYNPYTRSSSKSATCSTSKSATCSTNDDSMNTSVNLKNSSDNKLDGNAEAKMADRNESLETKPEIQTNNTSVHNIDKLPKDNTISENRIQISQVAKIEPGSHIYDIATTTEGNVWCRYGWKNDVALININGEVIKTFRTEFTPIDIKVTSTGDLLFIEIRGHCVWKYADGQFTKIIKFSPYYANGLGITANDEILVCLCVRLKETTKVIRATMSGEITQTLMRDEDDKRLFSEPHLACENINKDLCIVDNHHTLFVFDQDGEKKFKFPSSEDSEIYYGFYDIECDEFGNIILSNPDRHCIHFLSIDGQYIGRVMTLEYGIIMPWSLSIDKKRQLWINDSRTGHITVMKYTLK